MRRSSAPVVVAGLLSLAGCAASGSSVTGATGPPAPTVTVTVTVTAQPEATGAPDPQPAPEPLDPVEAAYDRLSPAQRVGQLFMFGLTSTGPSEEMYDAMATYAGGNAFLRGPSDLGATSVRSITERIEQVATVEGVRPFVSADQESGNAQALEGEGFSDLPTGLSQGAMEREDLRVAARGWADQLHDVGVNLDLAPVADVVPAEVGVDNDPIGFFRREYAATPEEAAPAVGAFVRGMQVEGVATSVKHFPGLGRATGNTDSDPTATDPTVRGDPLLEPFQKGVRAGSAFVMVSSAHYPGIDTEHRACFSPTVLGDMIRGDLGFDGVIISDSFGSASVAAVPAGERATRFLAAGGTMVLDTNYLDLEPMTTAVLARMVADPVFAGVVEHDVRLVLIAKHRFGLLDSPPDPPLR